MHNVLENIYNLGEDYPYGQIIYIDLNIKHDTDDFKKFKEKISIMGWKIYISEKPTRFQNDQSSSTIDYVITRVIPQDLIQFHTDNRIDTLSDHALMKISMRETDNYE